MHIQGILSKTKYIFGYSIQIRINVKCLECGNNFKVISNTHLKKCCGLTTTEYRTKHQLKYLVNESIRLQSVGNQNPNYKDGRSHFKYFCFSCGNPITGRGKTNLCKQCSVKGKQNPFYGKKHSQTTKVQMKKSAGLRDIKTYKYGTASFGVISKAQKAFWKTIPKEHRAQRISKFIKEGQKHNKKNKNTKIEKEAKRVLIDIGISFTQTYPIPTTLYVVDFLLNDNIIIELYGDYWHCNPKLYDKNYYHKNLKMTAQDKWIKDKKRITTLETLGYRVFIIWESDNIEKTLRNIKG